MRYKANLDGSDTDNAAAGTYKRKDRFIYRTKDDGSKMMPLYIYKDRMCTSYYKLEKKQLQQSKREDMTLTEVEEIIKTD